MHGRKWVTNSKVISDLIPKDDKAVVFDLLAENYGGEWKAILLNLSRLCLLLKK